LDIIKQYIVQSLTAASNNLRLTTHQLEALGLLRETLLNSEDLISDIDKMKTITELSTLAIRLNEIYSYLTKSKLDFFKFSDQFKEHSQYLINDLTSLLEIDNPVLIKEAITKLNGKAEKNETEEINVELTNHNTNTDNLIVNNKNSEETASDEFEENNDNGEDVFKSYEESILKPIKPLDKMLNGLISNEVSYDDISRFAEIMKMNGEISEKNGFEIISSMHRILYKALMLLKSHELIAQKEIIESMRACLIVIVAVVRGKDVDITNYLNKAEDFEKEINAVKN
jgi:hypothetical protein